MIKAKSIITLAMSLVLLLTFFGCNQKQQKNEALVVGMMTTIEKATRGEYSYDVLSGVMTQMSLVSIDETGNPIPLAATFSTKDSKTWEYKLIKGLKWEDGIELTGADVIFTMHYLDEHEGKSFLRGENATYDTAVLSEDGMTITFVLKNANIKDANNMSTMRIMPKHIYEGKKMTEVSDEDSRIGCGAYKFEKFDKNSGTVSFVASNTYVGGIPNIERVIFKMYSNMDTMYLALSYNEVDIIYIYSSGITPIAISTLSKNDSIKFLPITATNLPAVLTFNNSTEPFNDINIRQAVKNAIDYDKFKELFSSSYGQTPETGFVPKGTAGYVPTTLLKRDLKKAKEFLTKAEYSENDIIDGFHTKDGTKLSFVLTVNGGKEAQVRYAELVKENLKEIGIHVVVESVDGNTYSAKTANKYSNNNPTHQSSIMGYTSAGMGMLSGLGTIYIDGNHTVQGGARVFDNEFSRIISNMLKSETLEEYNLYAKDCVNYYAENVPAIALFWDSSVQAYNKKLSGFVIDGNFGLLNYRTWFSIKVDNNKY